MKTRAHVLVNGQVQGVFFRYETRNYAKKFNVMGWVRNLPDGRVEALFEGEKNDVQKLVEFCRKGPIGARVESVDVQWSDYKGEFNSFRVVY